MNLVNYNYIATWNSHVFQENVLWYQILRKYSYVFKCVCVVCENVKIKMPWINHKWHTNLRKQNGSNFILVHFLLYSYTLTARHRAHWLQKILIFHGKSNNTESCQHHSFLAVFGTFFALFWFSRYVLYYTKWQSKKKTV